MTTLRARPVAEPTQVSRSAPARILNISQVPVSTAAAILFNENENRNSIAVTNLASGTLYVGDSAVSSTSGHGIPANATFTTSYTGQLYGILASGTGTATVAEEVLAG